MDASSMGLVLRVRPYSDTSVIVHWLTLDHGRIGTLAKGARQSKSPFRGRLDLFYECEFSWVPSRRSSLHTLREVRLLNPHSRLREDLGWVEQASYASALVEQTTETDTPIPEIAALFRGLVAHLPSQPPQARTVLAFELKLLRELGLGPEEGGEPGLAARLMEAGWAEIATMSSTHAEARALHHFLHGFLIRQFGRHARGRAEALRPGSGSGAAGAPHKDRAM
jgi:DNA repair protein RecO (recombination protein O)